MSNVTVRHFEFTPDAEERLQRLMDKMCVNSAGYVIHAALTLLEWAQGEMESGRKVGSLNIKETEVNDPDRQWYIPSRP